MAAAITTIATNYITTIAVFFEVSLVASPATTWTSA
jgi:hypothetical protein